MGENVDWGLMVEMWKFCNFLVLNSTSIILVNHCIGCFTRQMMMNTWCSEVSCWREKYYVECKICKCNKVYPENETVRPEIETKIETRNEIE